MRISKRKTYIFWIALAEAVGFLSGWLSRAGTEQFSQAAVQPPLSPPAVVFPVVWTLLYALMGIGAARVSLRPDSPEKHWAINLFVAQLTVNFFWSLIFFHARAYGFAFFWLLLLLGLVIGMTLKFRQTDPAAGLLQIPYILWLVFAGYLNLGVWLLNP